ncbi:hypothetical protein NS220_07745 [Microbacterium testaceum]|uniref:alpha-amylase n=1 Tax=Microbacterium testaceum TaxID=2033 RepID=A0A147EYH0_MICTE|nr:carboxypeptidase-like regulatory domain-containing protein [Microbacterium testaceum]KTR94792.1 hypothetical protein NS220_07745 [Microbacterium testaceum]
MRVAPVSTAVISGKVTFPQGVNLAGGQTSASIRSSNSWYSATVASDGTYSFSGLPAGTYYIQFQSYGRNVLDQWYGGNGDFSSATPVTVDAGQTRTGVNATLVKGGEISGTVTTTAGAAVASARVVVYRKSDGSWMGQYSTGTDSDGAFSFSRLLPGEYTLSFGAPDGANLISEWWNDKTTLASASSVTVAKGQSVTGLKAQLSTAGTVTGTVAYADKTPVAQVAVTAYDRAGDVVGRGSTDDSGRYSIPGLGGGSIAVAASAPGGMIFSGGTASLTGAAFVTVKAGARVTVDIGVAGVTVRGKVTVAGTTTPLTAGTVTLAGASGPQGAAVAIAADGSYTVRGVSAGKYVALVTPGSSSYVPTWSDGTASKDRADYFAVPASGATKDLTVVRAGKVTLTPAVTGYVALYRWASTGTTYVKGDYVSAGSTFTAEGLAPGEYTVLVGRYYLGGAPDESTASHFTVSSGKTKSLGRVDTTPKNGGVISGRITATDATFASVTAYDATGRSYYASSTSSASGMTYSLPNLPAGTYTVSAQLMGYPTAWYGGRKAATVSVTNGTTTTADITAARADASLSGKVTKAGAAAAGAGVQLLEVVSSTQTGQISYATAAPDGSYSFGKVLLSGRTYRVTVWVPGAPEKSVTFTASSGTLTKNVTLDVLGQLSGRVSDRGTGKAAANIPVRAVRDGDTGDGYSTVTDAAGGYDFTGLRAGTYRVQFGAYSSGYAMPTSISGYGAATTPYYAPEWLDDSGTREGATAVTVTAGAKTTAKAGAVEQGGTVTGRVSGKTASGSSVWLTDATVSVYTLRDQLVVRTSTGGGAPGGYALSLRPGTYKICASLPESSAYAGLQPACRTGTVAVTAGKITGGMDVALTSRTPPPRSRTGH